MKKKMIFIWLLMLGTLTSCQSCSSEYKNVNEIIVEELEIPVPLGDPFILLHNGTYYAYGTHSDEGIEVYISVTPHISVSLILKRGKRFV